MTERTSPKATQAAQGAVMPSRGLMPPHLVLPDFLDKKTVADLLAFTLVSEPAFEATMVGRFDERVIKSSARVSVATRNLGEFRPILRSKLLALVPVFVAKFGMPQLEQPRLELQLVAHNDGAFFRRHIDTFTAPNLHSQRVLSAIYYFHAEPKGFAGGALRLCALGGSEDEDFTDVEPVHNRLLVFPSWAPHEVKPVTCPSKRFIDSRFAVNCWIYRTKPALGCDDAGANKAHS
jgi:predicted 2-oxoglutarate/Fe(II)-dependent dioxygenase YbiX